MGKTICFRLFILMVLAGIILPSCRQQDQKNESEKNTLFHLVPPRQSDIMFANQLRETDSANAIFYEYYYNGAGLALGDLNNDGLSDIVFGANMTESRVYLNNGNLSFSDITKQSGVNTAGKWITGVSLVDINQDGWLDIYLCAAGNINYDYHNFLYVSNGKKDNLAFKECAAAVGLDDNGYSTQAEFFDYDRDGDLDMYLVTAALTIPNKNAIRERKNDGSMINTDRLYRNDGINPLTKLPVFHNVSREAGITWDGFGLGASVCDINKDGWPDIYIGNDYISNDLLYINQRNGTFRDMIKDYTKHISNSTMGVDIADFNNDGLVDILSLDMQPEDYYRKRTMALTMRDYKRYMNELKAGYSPQYIRNMLQLNNGEIEGKITLSEIGQLAGVFETDWSWAPLFADFDNDGYKDLFIGNGIPHDVTNMDISELWMKTIRENPGIQFSVLYKLLKNEMDKIGNIKKPNVIFQNTRGLVFEKKSKEWGLEKPLYSTGSAFSDLDNDGDLDLVLNNVNDQASILENCIITKDSARMNSHFLTIILKGDSKNNAGIGTKISVYCGKKLQYYEHFPIRGFQSMVDPQIHFGLGENTIIDSLYIWWPDGKEQYLYNIKSDQFLTIRYQMASFTKKPRLIPKNTKLFATQTEKTNIKFKHNERQFIDFDIQPLVPHLYSQEGPGIAVGDVNSDGLDDFFIGGSTGFSGMIFTQGKSGTFSSYTLPGQNNYEDMGALLFDADGDTDIDLYVVSGGSGLPPGNAYYTDRLYINDSKGHFVMDKNALPDERVCGSQVTAADFDRDGDLDLFVCGRINLENYPIPPRSFLLRNDSKGSNIRFTDVTSLVSKDLEKPGLVASALWTDFNRDGWSDLIIAGEWMPITFFKNDRGKLINVTSSAGLDKYTGWWNSIAAGDFDKDGDIDYAAGNLGLNTQYKVSQSEPMRVIAKDFDLNGSLDPVCSYYVQGKSYPIYHRNILLSQIPSLKNKYNTYEDYAKASIDDIFPENTLKDAYIRDCRFFESAWIENLGNSTFRIHPLPVEAQISPVFGILSGDYNSDGNPDLLLTGNSYSSNIYTGQYDASIGLFMAGNGKGGFSPVPGRESGFFVDGDAKALAELILKDGSSLILAALNSDSLKVIKPLKPSQKSIRLKNDDVSAEITYKNGDKEYLEFYYGSGYLSQSSRVCPVPEGVVSVTFTTYKGESRKTLINNNNNKFLEK
jgi:enediyne biosynthesis protein E4